MSEIRPTALGRHIINGVGIVAVCLRQEYNYLATVMRGEKEKALFDVD